MAKKEQNSKLVSFFSGIYVLMALVLLLWVCNYCYPSVQTEIREVLGGVEDGAVHQAFGALAEGLEEGEPIRETLAQSAQILFHEEG